jgi:hypothetical protein
MPTRTSGIPNLASWAAMRQPQAAATSSPPPRHQPGSRAITGAGNWRTALAEVAQPGNEGFRVFGRVRYLLMSAPPIMLFSLWPARITARICLSPASFENPSRTPSVTAELRDVERAGAVQIVSGRRRGVADDAAVGIEHFHLKSSTAGLDQVTPGESPGLSRDGDPAL